MGTEGLSVPKASMMSVVGDLQAAPLLNQGVLEESRVSLGSGAAI